MISCNTLFEAPFTGASDDPQHRQRLRGWWQDVQDGFMTEEEFHERKRRFAGRMNGIGKV